MEIYKASVLGFCYGVKRAMKIAENAANSGIKAVTYGPIIHNPQVVEKLSAKGVHPVDDLDALTDETVIIRSHGVGPSCYNKLKCKNLALMDATCPFVKRNQEVTRQLVEQGKQVVLIGEKKHPEMKSVAEWAVGHSFLVETMEDVDALPPMEEAHIVTQTTFSVALADQLIDAIRQKVNHVYVNKSICDATMQRQQAARELARKVDVMIVIGGRNSANTGRLAEVCRSEGAAVHHIETAEEHRGGSLYYGKHERNAGSGRNEPGRA